MYCYLNGKFVDKNQATLSVNERGFLLADGLFETMIAVRGKIRCLGKHMDRMNRGLEFFQMPLTGLQDHIEEVYPKLLAHNRLEGGTASLRLTITRGEGERGLLPPDILKPTVLLTANNYNPDASPLTLILSSFKRNNSSPLCSFKTLNYQEAILARLDAVQRGAEDAIMLNNHGRPICTTVGNLFAVIDKKVITPPLAEGILPGITREIVLSLTKKMDIPHHVNPIQPLELSKAEAAFVTSSLVGIRSIKQIEDSMLDTTHPFIIRLRGAYEKFLLP